MARFAIALHEPTPADTLRAISRAEELGVPAVWLTSGSAEQMTILAAAAARIRTIGLGTAIVPTYPRHPLVLAQQAAVLHTLAPGRFRLGVGPSHRPLIEDRFGLAFQRPLEHLREYVAVLRQALQQGQVDFEGRHFRVHFGGLQKAEVPVLISALRPASFRLAGEISDGGIAWICPADYLATRARPALEEGARRAGRPAPPLLGHLFLYVTEDPEGARQDARQRLALYPRLPFYREMLRLAGDEEAARGSVSQALVEAVVALGPEPVCARRLRQFARESTADEVIVSLASAGPDRGADLEAGMRLVASLAGSGARGEP
jgi:F420-dependent oxidoreductase-like protein